MILRFFIIWFTYIYYLFQRNSFLFRVYQAGGPWLTQVGRPWLTQVERLWLTTRPTLLVSTLSTNTILSQPTNSNSTLSQPRNNINSLRLTNLSTSILLLISNSSISNSTCNSPPVSSLRRISWHPRPPNNSPTSRQPLTSSNLPFSSLIRYLPSIHTGCT